MCVQATRNAMWQQHSTGQPALSQPTPPCHSYPGPPYPPRTAPPPPGSFERVDIVSCISATCRSSCPFSSSSCSLCAEWVGGWGATGH